MYRKDLDRAQVFFAMAAVLYAVMIAEAKILKAIDALSPGPSGFHVFVMLASVVAVVALVLCGGRESS